MAVVVLAACAAASSTRQASGSGRPNIVMIVSDDAGYNDFGFMADLNGRTTDMLTPNLDALASESVVMSSGYVSAAVCSPSRAGFLTGQYSQRFGYEDNPGEDDGFTADQTLISYRLKDLGYTTGAIGKWHVGETDGVNRPLDMGFDEFYGFFHGSRNFWDVPVTDASRHMRRGDQNIEHLWATEGDASRYDPVNGRYLTDALGEESVDFINRHAGAEEPFFLYVSLNAPHTPIQAKSEDLAQFPGIEDAGRQKLAAMTLSLDRAVGDINAALAANNIDEDTILVFFNDNGGPSPSNGAYDNGPLRGYKGSMFEGGIRVPYFIKAPGLTPGVYDQPVTSLDLTPTLVNWAGGDATAFETDGVDLEPFLTGQIADAPHEVMFWRGSDGRFAVRKGDWKLVRPGRDEFARLHRVSDDINEANYLNSSNQELVGELLRELTYWEATLQKGKWGALGAEKNEFDHFVFRGDAAEAANWSDPGAWHEGGTTNAKTLAPDDSYANAVLEFRTRDDASYTANHDMRRWTNQTFMLNSIVLSGQFGGAEEHSAQIGSSRLLFTNSLDGAPASLRLEATRVGVGASFAFELSSPIDLFDDLLVTGDGDQRFTLSGPIADYHEPRGLRKEGSSTLTLTAMSTFTGDLEVNGGTLKLSGAEAGVVGPRETHVGSLGWIDVEDGVLATDQLTVDPGGIARLLGGRLETPLVVGNLFNDGGRIVGTSAAGPLRIDGDLLQTSGTLDLVIRSGGPRDAVSIGGAAVLGGALEVRIDEGYAPRIGDQILLVSAGEALNLRLEDVTLPEITDAAWLLRSSQTELVLMVGLPGDFNGDFEVNAADYTVWRDGLGLHYTEDDYQLWLDNFGRLVLPGDFNSDFAVDAADYTVWRDGVGQDYLSLGFEDWRDNFGRSKPHDNYGGDFNLDGVIDAADYTLWRDSLGVEFTPGDYHVWRDNYGRAVSVPSPRAAAPAPSSAALAALILALAPLSGRWQASRR